MPRRTGRGTLNRVIIEWTRPAYVAVLLGSAAFVVLFVPILALQSRRYGGLNAARLLGAAAFSVYCVALVAYTVLPLPTREWCATHEVGHNLHPFASLDDIRTATAGAGIRGTLTSFAFLQVAFNVVLFVPWGVFMRRYFGLGFITTVLSGFLASFAIEVTQGTGSLGLLGCAYRVADIDDIITNTTGALLGAIVAPVLLGWMPSAERLESRRGHPRPITRTRRLAGMLVDGVLFTAVGASLTLTYRMVVAYGLGRPMPGDDDWFNQAVPALVALVTVVIVPALIGSGASLGQRTMWLEPQFGRQRRLRALLRAATGFGAYATVSAMEKFPGIIGTGWGDLLDTIGTVFIVVTIAAVVFGSSRRGLSFRLSGADLIDARATGQAPTPVA